MTPIVVLGDVMVDVVACLAGPIARGSDSAADIRTYGGGSAANVAAWLAALGADVTLVGRVGADAYGHEQVSGLTALGVHPLLATDPEVATGTCIVLVEPGGERTMVPDRGANLRLAAADVPDAVLRPGGHLHLSGYALLDDGPRPAALDVLARARRAGMTVSVDPSSAAPLAALGAERFLDWTGGADLVLPNRDEAGVLTGCLDPAEAARALTGSYAAAVVTVGADGAVYADAGSTLTVAATRCEVVDTTGAGDAFTAGFLATWLDGRDAAAALAAGARLAARAVSIVGARPAQPSITGSPAAS